MIDTESPMPPALASLMTLRERAEVALRERRAKDEKDRLEHRAAVLAQAKLDLMADLSRLLGIHKGPEPVAGQDFTVIEGVTVEIDGLVFGRMRRRASPPVLAVQQECKRGCDKPLWVALSDWQPLVDLGIALDYDNAHPLEFECLVQRNDEGEPITDREGKPLPVPSAKPKEPPAAPSLADLIEEAVRGIIRDELGARGLI